MSSANESGRDAAYFASTAFGSHRLTVNMATIITLYATVATFGFIANAIIFVTLIVKGGLNRNVTSIFVTCLALSDMFLCVFNAPIQLYYELAEPTNLSEISCRILFASLGVPTYVSCILMLLIAIDRYRSIIYPLRKRISSGFAMFLLLGSILLSIVAASPVAYFMGVQKVLLKLDSNEDDVYDDKANRQSASSEREFPQYCVERWPNPESRLAYTILVFFGNFFAPLVCTAVLYMHVACWLKRHSNNLQGNKVSDSSDGMIRGGQRRRYTSDSCSPTTPTIDIPLQTLTSSEMCGSADKTNTSTQPRSVSHMFLRIERRNRRTNRILVSIVICFAVCWTPWTLYSLYLEYIAYNLTMTSRDRYSVAEGGSIGLSGHDLNQTTRNTAIENSILRNQMQLRNANLKLTDIFLKLFALCSTCTNPFFYGWLNENIRGSILRKFTRKETRERFFHTSNTGGSGVNFKNQVHLGLIDNRKASNGNGTTGIVNLYTEDRSPKILQQTDL